MNIDIYYIDHITYLSILLFFQTSSKRETKNMHFFFWKIAHF